MDMDMDIMDRAVRPFHSIHCSNIQPARGLKGVVADLPPSFSPAH